MPQRTQTQKNGQEGFAHMALIVIAVLALVVGSGVYIYGQQKDTDPVASEAEVADVSLSKPLPDDLLAVEKIKDLAKSDKPGTAIQQIELESEGATLLYKVRLSDGSFILYNARSGVKVTKAAKEAAEVEKDAALPAGFTPTLTFDKAREIALKEKSGNIRKIELEVEGGVVVYSVRYSDDARIDIDAKTGAIVRTKAAKTQAGASPSTPTSSAGTATRSESGTGGTSGTSGSGTSGSNSGSGSDDASSSS